MLVGMTAVDRGDVDGHRTVQEDGHVRQLAAITQPRQVQQHGLGTSDGERGDEHDAPASRHAPDHVAQDGFRVLGRVSPIAVGRLGDQDRCRVECPRRPHQRIIGSAQVPGEVRRAAADRDPDAGGPEDVTGGHERDVDVVGDAPTLIEVQWSEPVERVQGVVGGVERSRVRVLRPVGGCRVPSLLLQEVPAVGQMLAAQLDRPRRRDTRGRGIRPG